MRTINVLAIQRISADDRAKIEASDPAIQLIDAGGWFEGEIRETWSDHPSNNRAKRPFDFSVRVPRTQLRPRYGDGFDGAPLTGRRPRGEGRAGGGGADDPARSANPASAGAGESRDHPVQQPMACRSFRAVASASGAPLGAACRALDRAQE